MGVALDEIRETEEKRLDYVGFTFDGIHSSQLKILSVSSGNRYSWDLLPAIEDYSIDITGGYGSNYFGGKFKTREISVNIAFDEVEEIHLRAMRELFSEREVHQLFFDENPYLVYNAVISRTPNIKFIAFGDVGTRIYKGEGAIVFTCYDPIAYSLNGNYLDGYDWENIDEWAAASGMLDNKKKRVNNELVDYYDTPIPSSNGYVIHAYNAGNIPTPILLDFNWTGGELYLENTQPDGKVKFLKMKKDSTVSSSNTWTRIDTSRSVAMQLFKNEENGEVSEFNAEKTQVIYNNLVVDGRFFMLPPGYNELTITGVSDLEFTFYHRYI